MPLTDKGIRTQLPGPKQFKKYDSNGLFLLVNPSGSKLWRYEYSFERKRKLLALGEYPAVSLAQARAARDEARLKVLNGIDPAAERKQRKQQAVAKARISENTFGKAAKSWFDRNASAWTEKNQKLVWARLEKNILPWMKSRPLSEIEAPEILEHLRRIEDRGAVELARRVSQIVSQIFRFSIAAGLCSRNPVTDLQGALAKRTKRNWPALTEPQDISKLLNLIDEYSGSFVVRCALLFSALTFVRPGELRKAEWSEFDFQEKIWVIPAVRMKMKRDHLVPLSRQSAEVLEELRPMTGAGAYVFPAQRGRARPMSENTVNYAIRQIGFGKDQMVAHGFRATASTRLHELGWDSRIIEVQLAHIDQNAIRSAYNRAEYLPERRKMMQAWADYLDQLRAGCKIIPLRQNTG